MSSFTQQNSLNKINVDNLLRPEFCARYFAFQIADSGFKREKAIKVPQGLAHSFKQILE